MFTSRLSKPIIMAIITAIALLTVSFVISPKDSRPYLDYAQRHPREARNQVANKTDTSSPEDYYHRHFNDMKAVHPLDVSDYFLRHPELFSGAAKEVDLNDYYLRHYSGR